MFSFLQPICFVVIVIWMHLRVQHVQSHARVHFIWITVIKFGIKWMLKHWWVIQATAWTLGFRTEGFWVWLPYMTPDSPERKCQAFKCGNLEGKNSERDWKELNEATSQWLSVNRCAVRIMIDCWSLCCFYWRMRKIGSTVGSLHDPKQSYFHYSFIVKEPIYFQQNILTITTGFIIRFFALSTLIISVPNL